MEQVKEIGYLEYLFAFEACRTPLSDFYAKYQRGLRLLGSYGEEKQGQGVLLYAIRGDLLEIFYVGMARKEQEGKQHLIEAAIEIGRKSSAKRALIRVGGKGERGEAFRGLLENMGFSITRTVETFRSQKGDYGRWQIYMKEHGNKILTYLEAEGFRPVPFREATASMLQQVRKGRENGFDKGLEPNRILNGEKGRFCEEISFLSLKEKTVAAYCLVSQPGKLHYVFEIISASKAYQNTGVIFQPFAFAVNAVGEYPYQSVGFAMDQENRKALALSGRVMRSLISARDLQYHYERQL